MPNEDDAACIRENIRFEGDAAAIDLWYPQLCSVKAIEVGLMDTRAADSLRLEYDFKRDGWVIKQASTFRWPLGDTVCDPDWQEVAFIKAWARDRERVG